MSTLLKQSFIWQFAAGFAIGAVGLVALQPSAAKAQSTPAPTHLLQR